MKYMNVAPIQDKVKEMKSKQDLDHAILDQRIKNLENLIKR